MPVQVKRRDPGKYAYLQGDAAIAYHPYPKAQLLQLVSAREFAPRQPVSTKQVSLRYGKHLNECDDARAFYLGR